MPYGEPVEGTPFGRYRLSELLGRGGLGEVWRAYDTATGRSVVLKLVPSNFARDQVFRERFQREASSAAGLDEPHVVPIYDFGEIEGRLYATMRLIRGQDLRVVLDGGPLEPARAVDIIDQIASALHAAHETGLVHRNVKPSNILVAQDDFAYLDFDFASVAVEGRLTSADPTTSTFSYMAPERLAGRADRRADIYALACVLHEALTGRPPYPGDTLEQQAAGHLTKPPPRPSLLRPAVPEAFDAVIATGLAKVPDQRYPTAKDLARAARVALTAPGNARAAPPPTYHDARRAESASRLRIAEVGVSWGTSNSTLAALVGGRPIIVPNAEGSQVTPSVVAFTPSGEVLVGQPARNQAVTNVDRTIQSLKRHIGSDWSLEIDGRDFSAQEISARTLMKLKGDAESYLGGDITDVVMTVPASFDNAQRQAIKDAGQIAGFNVLRMINESTAAALTYGWTAAAREQTVLVLDLGGGMCEASLLEMGDGVVEVRATSGDSQLGGDDWDQRIVKWVLRRFWDSHAIDLARDRVTMERLREAAHRAKVELSSVQSTSIQVPYVARAATGTSLSIDEELTRAEFQRVTQDLLDRIRIPFLSVIVEADVSVADIDHVVLVGGSTRMPAVTELVKELTGGKEPNKGVNPDEAVAIGAALQAGVLSGKVKEILLLDVTPLSLGIETKGGVLTKLLERNTTIPTKRSETLTTADDNQPSVQILIYQGEREMASANKLIGAFELTGIPPAPRGVPQIEITFDVDANGILHVTAKDKGTGKENTIRIQEGSGLSASMPSRRNLPTLP